jgi:hypothetical protein
MTAVRVVRRHRDRWRGLHRTADHLSGCRARRSPSPPTPPPPPPPFFPLPPVPAVQRVEHGRSTEGVLGGGPPMPLRVPLPCPISAPVPASTMARSTETASGRFAVVEVRTGAAVRAGVGRQPPAVGEVHHPT